MVELHYMDKQAVGKSVEQRKKQSQHVKILGSVFASVGGKFATDSDLSCRNIRLCRVQVDNILSV